MNSVRDYLLSLQQQESGTSGQYEISSCPQLIERIQQLGFLPLLDSGIDGYCAEEMMAPDYHYVQFDDGSWDWPLWTWKGPAITEGNCVYGKFFGGKAGFISREWWCDFYKGTLRKCVRTLVRITWFMAANQIHLFALR